MSGHAGMITWLDGSAVDDLRDAIVWRDGRVDRDGEEVSELVEAEGDHFGGASWYGMWFCRIGSVSVAGGCCGCWDECFGSLRSELR